MNLHNDVRRSRMQIEALLREHPALAEDEALRADVLEGEGVTDVLDRLVTVIREREMLAGALGGRIKQMQDRKEAALRGADSLRGLVLQLMETAGLKSYRATEATLSVSNGRPSVVITDEAALPEWAVRYKREPVKGAIMDGLTVGAVPGAELSNGAAVLTMRVT